MGNRLVYRTREPEKVASQLEERVRADLGSAVKVPYEVHDTRSLATGGYLQDVGRLLTSSDLDSLATIVFKLPWHRPASLAVIATRVGLTAQCASLLYEIELARPIEVAVTFEKKAFTSDLEPGAPIVARLNAVPDLTKRLDKLVRDVTAFGALVIRQPSHCSISTAADGARLLIRTLGRPTGFLMNNATTDAGEALALAKLVESAL